MIDEEELALVVPGPVSKTEGLFNYLLHGANGQWGLGREFFEAGAVSIDRGIVEVGAEEIFSLLLGIADKDLATKAYNRLVRLAVAVACKTTAVEIYHLSRVFLIPKDIVMEETIAVISSLLGNLRRTN